MFRQLLAESFLVGAECRAALPQVFFPQLFPANLLTPLVVVGREIPHRRDPLFDAPVLEAREPAEYEKEAQQVENNDARDLIRLGLDHGISLRRLFLAVSAVFCGGDIDEGHDIGPQEGHDRRHVERIGVRGGVYRIVESQNKKDKGAHHERGRFDIRPVDE